MEERVGVSSSNSHGSSVKSIQQGLLVAAVQNFIYIYLLYSSNAFFGRDRYWIQNQRQAYLHSLREVLHISWCSYRSSHLLHYHIALTQEAGVANAHTWRWWVSSHQVYLICGLARVWRKPLAMVTMSLSPFIYAFLMALKHPTDSGTSWSHRFCLTLENDWALCLYAL
jgi:hypothetical protein